MFLSREFDIKLCQNYTKIHKYATLYKKVFINRSYSAITQPIWKRLYPTGAWESIIFLFYILIDVIVNIITYSPYRRKCFELHGRG